ncbi:EAL domain-containing protein [Tahibacter amnicola]|uniref:EAL domain-containing protein n=1 Tax=Tahibacter amnicola TaxID=2976241 RepID=A0ABY6B9Z4_9GAMM|nr:EAL domain-containing protein [Tahibacter amnicola]UXI66361.1 EAL domain-containing protein [Tahibacter amnicola]
MERRLVRFAARLTPASVLGISVPVALLVFILSWLRAMTAQDAIEDALLRHQRLIQICQETELQLVRAHLQDARPWNSTTDAIEPPSERRAASFAIAPLRDGLRHEGEFATLLERLESQLAGYESSTAKSAELLARLGGRETGIAQELRLAYEALELALRSARHDRLLLDAYRLRRAERDFATLGGDAYVEVFQQMRAQLLADTQAPEVRDLVPSGTQQLLQTYSDAFDRYVAVSLQLAATRTERDAHVRAADETLQSLAGSLRERAGELTSTLAHERANLLPGAGFAGLATLWVGLALTGLCAWARQRAPARRIIASGEVAALGPPQLAPRQDRDEPPGSASRAMQLLSECSHALVHSVSEQELITATLHRIVHIGGYVAAWSGEWSGEGGAFRAVSYVSASNDALAADYTIDVQDDYSTSPTANAIRRGQFVVTSGVAAAVDTESWFERAAQHGIRAAISLPLRQAGAISGVLVIYSRDADVFTTTEIELLAELADDLAFGTRTFREREDRQRVEAQLDYQSHYDELTGLPNRNSYADRMRELLRTAKAENRLVALLNMGLEKLRSVNDNIGAESGNSLLRQVTERLRSTLDPDAFLARIGGDRFAVVLDNVRDEQQAADIARRLLAAVMAPMHLGGREYYPNACVGVSLFPRDGEDAQILIRNAASAMLAAREIGGGSVSFYDPLSGDRESAGFALETALRGAMERHEFVLHFQAKADLATGRICGAEALVRWQHPTWGILLPGKFIGLAEETGLIGPLGAWIINDVCRQIATWRRMGLPDCPISVNLSPRQFRQDDLVRTVREALALHQVDAHLLELELTESAVMHDLGTAIATLRALKAVGVRCSLDDFGTGHSSLNYLKHFPIDRVKIDQSFVRDITSEPGSAAICGAVIGIAHNLNLKVVAEGVETEAQASYLRRCRCDEIQGHFFSPAVPPDDFIQQMRRRTSLSLPVYKPGPRTLLIVDDETNILTSLQRVLRDEGYDILIADGAAKGLDILATREVHVVLTDQRMPEMSGTEFLSRVRTLYPGTVRLVLSGYADLDTVIASVNRGTVFRFLTKPCREDVLLNHLRDAFRHYELEAAQRAV